MKESVMVTEGEFTRPLRKKLKFTFDPTPFV